MRRITTRARWTAGLTALAAALVALGTANADAAPSASVAAATTAGAADAVQPTTTGFGRRLPTAALRGLPDRTTGDGTTVVRVTYKKGVRVAAVAPAAPRAAALRAFGATTRSVGRFTNAATYTVADADLAGFLRAVRARADVADARPEGFARFFGDPNDPWYLTTTTTDIDQFTYLPGVTASPAWSYGHSSSAVKIAIVDSGVDVGHPDLDGKIVGTYNAVDKGSVVTDTIGHGTFVAGVAAAETDNGIGIAGAGWDASILAVKVADSAGRMAFADIADGINWAVANDADIINLSLGSTTDDPLVRAAVAAARAANVIVVASAGNDGQEGNPRSYPAANPGVVAVGATDAQRHRAWFSEHGSWVTMAAPGIDIRSTVPRTVTTFWPTQTSYAVGDGTSFSAPLVAGTMALVRDRSPNATDEQVIAAVVNTAHAMPGFGLGKGKLDMTAAMRAIVPTTAPTVTSPTDGFSVTDGVGLTATSETFGGGVGTRIVWFLDGTRIGSAGSGGTLILRPRGHANGPHTLQARTCNAAGVCPPSGTPVSVTFDAPAPTITSPADGSAVAGVSTVVVQRTAIDGSVAVYDGPTRVGWAPPTLGSFVNVEVNLTQQDGPHSLEAVQCDAAGTLCDSPRSAPLAVTSTSADLTRGTVTNAAFSPNGDGVKDTTAVGYTVAGTQTVRVQVTNQDGVPVRTITSGVSRTTGSYTTTWNGNQTNGLRAADGTYTVRITSTDAGGKKALVTASVRLDTQKSAFTVKGSPLSLYPAVDGYQDTWLPRIRALEGTAPTVTIRNSAGRTVRTLKQTLRTGQDWTLAWNGRSASGTLQPAGTYTWRVTAVDQAGVTSTSTGPSLTLGRQRLTNKTVTLTKTGLGAYAINNGPACAVATPTGSSYTGGLWLKNSCAKAKTDAAAAWFHVTAPAAVTYTGFTIRTTGRSHSAPVDVRAGLLSSQTTDYDLTYPTKRVAAGATTTRTLTLGTVRQGGYVGSRRVLDLLVYVSNAELSPLTDWDVKNVSVTVSYQALV